MQKKFAQRLSQHNAQTHELLSVVKQLTSLSKNQTENGDVELAERLANIAEKCADLVEEATKAFEEEHGEELELLQQALVNKVN